MCIAQLRVAVEFLLGNYCTIAITAESFFNLFKGLLALINLRAFKFVHAGNSDFELVHS